MPQQRSKNFPKDCLICALRPSLYINQTNVYQAKFFCLHSIPPSNPHFQSSRLLQVLTFLCNCILIYGLYNDLKQLGEVSPSKRVLIFIEAFLNISTLVCNLTCSLNHATKLRESHGVITLMRNKPRFDVAVLLSSEAARKMQRIFFYLSLMLLLEEAVVLGVALAIELADDSLFIRMLMVEILILSYAALGFYAIQFLFLYKAMFKLCLGEFETYLKVLENAPDLASRRSIFGKIQKLQRLYLSLRRNFKLNEEFLQPCIIIVGSLSVCLLLICYAYLAVLFVLGEVDLLKFEYFLLLKTVAIAEAFGFLCFEAYRISTLVQSSANDNVLCIFQGQDTLSFIFKYNTSKLSFLEANQIEMFINMLILQKPDVKASDIFTVGTGLLASILGTVVTYTLVALQFHALWATTASH